MTSRQRRPRRRSHSSPISRGNKTKDLEPRVYFRQDEVLKPTSTSLDQDNYPVYLLEAATVYTLDGERIANLLDVGVTGRVEVRGRLTILPDETEISHLRTPHHNGQWLAFSCDAFSIGWGPSVVWALGDRKWFEIQPSSEYKATYAQMTEGIAIYYYLTELYEQLAKQLTRYPIDSVFLLYAELEGSSLNADVIRKRIKNHASFLLTQMVKRGANVNWISTTIFKWLIAECPDIHRAVLEKNDLMLAPISDAPLLGSEVQVAVSGSSGYGSTPKDSTDSRSSPVAEQGRRQITTQGSPSTVEVIVRTMQELVRDHQNHDKITIATVWTALYHDLQVELPQARVILRSHAQQVVDFLDEGVWGNAQIYKDLSVEAALSNPSQESKELAQSLSKLPERSRKNLAAGARAKEFAEYGPTAMTIKLKPRKSAVYRRRPVKKSLTLSLVNRGATNDKRLSSTSPESEAEIHPTHGGKAVPPILRGKNAILRPSSTTPAQYNTDASSGRSSKLDRDIPVGIGGRGKKRKAIEPEMGDVSDDEIMWDAMDDVLQHEVMDDADGDNLDINLIDIPLPSTDPTGPNGSWVCPKENCSAIIHDTASEGGKLAIRKHLYSHADPQVMQYLVETETKRHGGVETKYLLEKIRQIGANKRMEEDAMQSGKLETVKPIKRAGV